MSREEEYIRRMRALGYEPSLAGMDDGDIEYELARKDRGREATPPQPVRTVYRPVDPGLAARILRQFGQPYDASAIGPRQAFYLNGWDDGEEGGAEGDPLRTMEERPRDGAMLPSRGGARPMSYTADGNDVNTGRKGTNAADANPYAGGYADGGAYGDMTLPDGKQQPATEGAGKKPSDKLVGFLANYEKYEEKPYKVGGQGNWTIGFGHEIKPGEDFSKGIGDADARNLLAKDIQEHADAINQWAADNNIKLTQQQYDALVSLRFNLGSLEGAPKLRSLIISGNATPEQIRREFEDIISNEKGPQPGLWRRRRDEANMFFNGDYRRTYPTPPKELFPNFSE